MLLYLSRNHIVWKDQQRNVLHFSGVYAPIGISLQGILLQGHYTNIRIEEKSVGNLVDDCNHAQEF